MTAKIAATIGGCSGELMIVNHTFGDAAVLGADCDLLPLLGPIIDGPWGLLVERTRFDGFRNGSTHPTRLIRHNGLAREGCSERCKLHARCTSLSLGSVCRNVRVRDWLIELAFCEVVSYPSNSIVKVISL